jgi:hypothetical protein
MALESRDIPVTREDVSAWFEEYALATNPPPLRDFIVDKVEALNLPDTEVSTTGRDNFGDTTSLVDLIMADVGSYGVSG